MTFTFLPALTSRQHHSDKGVCVWCVAIISALCFWLACQFGFFHTAKQTPFHALLLHDWKEMDFIFAVFDAASLWRAAAPLILSSRCTLLSPMRPFPSILSEVIPRDRLLWCCKERSDEWCWFFPVWTLNWESCVLSNACVSSTSQQSVKDASGSSRWVWSVFAVWEASSHMAEGALRAGITMAAFTLCQAGVKRSKCVSNSGAVFYFLCCVCFVSDRFGWERCAIPLGFQTFNDFQIIFLFFWFEWDSTKKIF